MGHFRDRKKVRISNKPSVELEKTNISGRQTQLVISYKYLCLDNKKYSFDNLDNKEKIKKYEKLYNKLKEYCEFEDFKTKITSDSTYSSNNHIHPIDWKDKQIRESCFNSLNTNLMEQVKDDCWQLGIDNQGFRIHGFFIENVFHIVWLDVNHQLYPRRN